MKNEKYVSYLVSLIKNLDYSMLSDAEWDALTDIDASDNVQLSGAIREVIKPEYASWDSSSRKLAKNALDACFALPDYDFGAVLRNVEMPFASNLNPRTFFMLVQQVVLEDSTETGRNDV